MFLKENKDAVRTCLGEITLTAINIALRANNLDLEDLKDKTVLNFAIKLTSFQEQELKDNPKLQQQKTIVGFLDFLLE